MDIRSLLSAVFLYCQGNETNGSSDVLDNHFSTSDIIEIAEQQGIQDLADAFKKSKDALNKLDNAETEEEYTKIYDEYRKQGEFIEQNI